MIVMILKWRLWSGDRALSREETVRISSAVIGSKGCFGAEVDILRGYNSVRAEHMHVYLTYFHIWK
jgi:hypothetical protein